MLILLGVAMGIMAYVLDRRIPERLTTAMLDDLWNGILELMAQFVIPDWGALIALLPVFIFVITIIGLVAIFLRLFRAPRPGAGKQRVDATTPAGIHMPGPSLSPIFASIGAVPAVPRASCSPARSWCSA